MRPLRMLSFVVPSALGVLCALPAEAQTTYYVDNTDGAASDSNDGSQASPWLSIGKCAATLVAGDTCAVQPGGIYDERVEVSTSGSTNAMIRFVAAAGTRPKVRGFTLGGGYIRVERFEITNQGMSADSDRSIVFTSQDHIEIIGNDIHDTAAEAIRAMDYSTGGKNAQYCLISGNTVARIGPETDRAVGIEVSVDDCLLEGNDVSHFEDAFRVFGQRNVVRNNVVHDVGMDELAGAHADALQSFCNGNANYDQAVSFLLVEGLRVYAMRGTDSHGILINGTDTCGGSSTVIVRGCSFSEIGSGTYYGDDNQAFGDHHKIYNNTIVTAAIDSPDHVSMTFSGIDFAGVFNNVYVDAIGETAPFSVYALKANGNSTGDYDLAFMSSGPKSWGPPIGDEPHAVLDQDPLFVDSTARNFALQDGSPARDSGGPLTTVAASDGGGGTSLVVGDAHFFQPGWAGTEADWIAVGSVGNMAQITAIDYESGTLTLASPLTRSAGDAVWLYKGSSGAVVLVGSAPDIGAFEYGAETDAGEPDGAGDDSGAPGDSGTGGSGAASGAGANGGSERDEGGCGCRVGSPSPSPRLPLALALLVLARRRRGARALLRPQ